MLPIRQARTTTGNSAAGNDLSYGLAAAFGSRTGWQPEPPGEVFLDGAIAAALSRETVIRENSGAAAGRITEGLALGLARRAMRQIEVQEPRNAGVRRVSAIL